MEPFPQEIIDMIVDYLYDSKKALFACSLVSRSWLPSSRVHLFQTLNICQIDRHFDSSFGAKAFDTLLVQSDQHDSISITPHIRDLRLYAEASCDHGQWFMIEFGTMLSIMSKVPRLRTLRLERVSLYCDAQSTALIHSQMKRFQLQHLVLQDFDVVSNIAGEDNVKIPFFQLISTLFSDIGQCTITFSQDPFHLFIRYSSFAFWNDGASTVNHRLETTRIGHLSYQKNHDQLHVESRHDHLLENIYEYMEPKALKCIELSLERALESAVASMLGGSHGEHIQKLILKRVPEYWEESAVKEHFDLRSCTALQDLTLHIAFEVEYQGPDYMQVAIPAPLIPLLHENRAPPNLRTLTIVMSVLRFNAMALLKAIDWDIIDSLAERNLKAVSLRLMKVTIRIMLRVRSGDIPSAGDYVRKSLPKLLAGEMLELEFAEP